MDKPLLAYKKIQYKHNIINIAIKNDIFLYLTSEIRKRINRC